MSLLFYLFTNHLSSRCEIFRRLDFESLLVNDLLMMSSCIRRLPVSSLGGQESALLLTVVSRMSFKLTYLPSPKTLLLILMLCCCVLLYIYLSIHASVYVFVLCLFWVGICKCVLLFFAFEQFIEPTLKWEKCNVETSFSSSFFFFILLLLLIIN